MCVPGAYDCEDTSWKDHKLSKIADSAANDLEFEKADKKKMAAADEGGELQLLDDFAQKL